MVVAGEAVVHGEGGGSFGGGGGGGHGWGGAVVVCGEAITGIKL